MMWRRALLFATSLLLIASAFGADVETDYDVQFEFGNVHYYRWADDADRLDDAYSTLPRDNLKFGIEQTLDQALVPANADHQPDVLVRYYIKDVKKLTDDRPRVGIGMGTGGGYGGGFSGGGMSFSFPLGGDNLDRQAQVIIDLLEPQTQRLLWRGSQVVGMSGSSMQVNERQVNKAAAEILKRFPPKQ